MLMIPVVLLVGFADTRVITGVLIANVIFAMYQSSRFSDRTGIWRVTGCLAVATGAVLYDRRHLMPPQWLEMLRDSVPQFRRS